MLHAVQIGNLVLPGNLVLSPMAGVTDAPFRAIALENGADYTISEMLTSQLHLWDSHKTKLRLDDKLNSGIKVMQIAGASPSELAHAALRCEELGANIVEINMGCPAKKVCNVLSGSALLRDESLVNSILAKVAKVTAIPVTLKTRLGWCHNSKNILTISKMAQDNGIKAITIHGRTRSDMYNGNATYDLIAEVKQNSSIPVFANGDIDTPQKAKYVFTQTGADGLYIGRAALGNPWLFKQIKDYIITGTYQSTSINVKQVIMLHMNYIYTHYPNPLGCRIARKHIKWYVKNNYIDSTRYANVCTQFNYTESVDFQLYLLESIFA